MKANRRKNLAETPEGREKLREMWRRDYQRRASQGQNVRGAVVGDIVAIDGEGITLPSGEHRFILLADSLNNSIYNEEGLSTVECFEFLLSLHKRGRKIVGFSLGYDINQCFRDLPPKALEYLAKTEQCHYHTDNGCYRVGWVPNKSLSIAKGQWVRVKGKNTWLQERSVKVWDTFGFFQSSFLKALREWKIGSSEELELIAGMKAQRAEFDVSQVEAITEYNALECKLLVDLIAALETTLLGADIQLQRWDGAGAVAAALLKSHSVKEHFPQTEEEQPPDEVMYAYYGGRIQALAIGRFEGPIYNYDINSAYPSVTANLPSLRGIWERASKWDSDIEWALWECEWDVGTPKTNPAFPLTPFPWRNSQGAILYPTAGRGWYWSPLVRVAKRFWGNRIRIRGGYVFRPEDREAEPFRWVRELYDIRREYKRNSDPRHIVLKLGLNSLYGKFAQGKGHKGRKPPYQSYVYAGLITATTQARLLEAALSNPAAMIAFATDGIFSRAPLEVTESSEMGSWEGSVAEDLFLVQPGLYAYHKAGKLYKKTRGFHPEELDYAMLLEGWKERGFLYTYPVKTRRFFGLKLAQHQNRMDDWRKFIDGEKVITCSPGRGLPAEEQEGEWLYWLPPSVPKGELPARYKPKGTNTDVEYEGGSSYLELLDQPDFIDGGE